MLDVIEASVLAPTPSALHQANTSASVKSAYGVNPDAVWSGVADLTLVTFSLIGICSCTSLPSESISTNRCS
jgi:hypothetical protein